MSILLHVIQVSDSFFYIRYGASNQITKSKIKKMENTNKSDEITISSNSNSGSKSDDDDEVIPKPKRRKCVLRKFRSYPIKKARVPRRCFNEVYSKIMSGKSPIELKQQCEEKLNCNRFILSETNESSCTRADNVSPESITRLVMEMRNAVQCKEYGDLAKLISIFTEMPAAKARWYSTVIKYCLVGLLYDPLVQGTGMLDLFLEGVIGCRTDPEKRIFLQNISQLPYNIHVTKFDDLWKVKDDKKTDQITEVALEKLCGTLSSQAKIDIDDQLNASDSEWESYDENESVNEDDDGMTEIEQAINFDDILTRIKLDICNKE